MTASTVNIEMSTPFASPTAELNPGLRIYSKLVCAAVLLLVFFGALVTSHDAGLSVPDWPTTYGENMFLYSPSKWVGPIFYEHVHRLIASFIGLLTVILTVWTLRVEKRGWVKVLSVLALGSVILQGLLGGLTVLLKLPDAVSVAHGMLAQTFFCLVIVIAYSQSRELRDRLRVAPSGSQTLFRGCLVAFGAIYLQLFFGAVMRHGGAGLAVPGFPTFAGAWWPTFDAAMLEAVNRFRSLLDLAPVTMHQVALHVTHRVWAVVAVAAVVWFALRVARSAGSSAKLRSVAAYLAFGIIVQFTLGALTVLSVRQPIITSLHVMVGALMLGLCVLAALRAYPVGTRK